MNLGAWVIRPFFSILALSESKYWYEAIPWSMNASRISICGPSLQEYWIDAHPAAHERIENQYLWSVRAGILNWRASRNPWEYWKSVFKAAQKANTEIKHYLSCPLLTKQLSALKCQGRSLAEVLCTLDASKDSAEYNCGGMSGGAHDCIFPTHLLKYDLVNRTRKR